ncbi:uncharacterized protein LOC133319320 [Danaus plexippus]|uniref:uncharacterized protein LOC133319320 n=1 Tax=Danaus plexippus TaxID=13037 RepID=UPI002AAF339E|nr:uncharacterized protein LOC133319320 [Danaus plexippus]
MVKLLGKFGLDYCDMPTLLYNISVLLRILTVKICRRYNEPISWTVYIVFIISAICYVYVYMFSVYWYILFRYPDTGDLLTVIVEISLSMCSLNCILKLFFIKIKVTSMMNLVDEYLYSNEFMVKNTRFEKRFLKNLKIVKKRAIFIWIFLFANGTMYNIIPLMMPGRHFSEDMYVIYGLEPMFESPNFEIASIMMAVGVYFAVASAVHIMLFMIVIVGCIEAQMTALSEELADIWEDSEKFYNTSKVFIKYIQEDEARNKFLEIRLKDVVKFQIINMNLRNKIEKELSFIFVVDFVIMIIAIVTELVGGLENTFGQIPFTVSQVVVACLTGQKLIDSSEDFSEAVYCCKWENFNVSNRKTILLMLQCSQQTLMLSAGGIAVMDLCCLMTIFKFAYSAYTTIKSSV